MKPGDYTVKLFKDELEVATNAVTVVERQTNTLNLVSTETSPTTIFRIGEWSGSPRGFLNASTIVVMHPQDGRNSNWFTGTVNAGTSATRDFPAIQFRGTNSPINITFNLAANQVATVTLRIGITCAYNGGRPKPTIGSWTPANPSASSQPSSRSFTIGTYRGNNAIYTWSVPASAFVIGQNTLSFGPISGSSDLGTWLSAGYVFDAVDLVMPNTTPAAPASPTNLTVNGLNGSQTQLSWTDNATNEVNCLIERSTDNASFQLVAAVSTGATNYTDVGLAPGTTYYYRLRAFNAGGYSTYATSVAAVTTLPRITTTEIVEGRLVFTGSGGPAGGTYKVLGAGDVASNPASWASIGTNVFDANGAFIHSNLMNSGSAQFFRLKIE
jgi:rhamnogalacturonan endolyase